MLTELLVQQILVEVVGVEILLVVQEDQVLL
jgi:hypothetical protein